MKLSIRAKLFVSFGVITFLSLVITGVLALYFSGSSTEKQVKNNLLNITDIMYQSVKNQYLLSNTLNSSLQKNNIDVAYNIIAGKIEVDPKRKMTLNIENQENHAIEKVQLPELYFSTIVLFIKIVVLSTI